MLVLVGPSASGKSAIVKCLTKKYGLEKFITCTTRKVRVGEIDGVDYHFLSEEEFSNLYNNDEFIEGEIYPDSVSEKSLKHYGSKSSKVILKDFLKENKLEDSYKKGYFLHLVTDYLFYNKYLDIFTKDIYNDYDILNKFLIEKYDVKIPSKVEDKIFDKEGKTKILTKELAEKVIDEISDLDLNIIEKEIRENPDDEKWLKLNEKIK